MENSVFERKDSEVSHKLKSDAEKSTFYNTTEINTSQHSLCINTVSFDPYNSSSRTQGLVAWYLFLSPHSEDL